MSNNEKMDFFVLVTVLATACAGGGKSASENDAAASKVLIFCSDPEIELFPQLY